VLGSGVRAVGAADGGAVAADALRTGSKRPVNLKRRLLVRVLQTAARSARSRASVLSALVYAAGLADACWIACSPRRMAADPAELVPDVIRELSGIGAP
jgi:hypothetical protein